MKKQHIISLIITLFCLIAIPISVLSIGFILPPLYNETYYGELPYMFKRLRNGKEGKIIFVGNSALAFGLRSDLIEKETNKEVIDFGLYGAIGTKAMMDLSKVGIKKNDIVILAPEISDQGLSLYYSAENMWMAVDGHYDMLKYVEKTNRQAMVGNFASFVSKKYNAFINNHTINIEGVYAQTSFNDVDGNEVGYMTYDRPYNVMLNGYDSNALITFDDGYLKDDFIRYMNEYARYIHKRGAQLYFGFVPMNNLAVTSSPEEIDAFYNALINKIEFPILGNPHQYLFDFDWFYDNNCHLNSLGTLVYNRQIVEDVKTLLDDSSSTNIEIPEKPVIPIIPYEDGDNSDVDCFNYAETVDGYSITSLSESGKSKSSIIIPSTYHDKPIVSFMSDVFKDNKTISEIIISKNIRGLFDYSFMGCSNLTRIVLQNDNPNKINVGTALLDGAPNVSIYVKKDAFDNFANHYNWGYYRNRIKTF